MRKDLEEVVESVEISLGSPFKAEKTNKQTANLTSLGLENLFDGREHSKETVMAEDEYMVRDVIQHKDTWLLPRLKIGS